MTPLFFCLSPSDTQPMAASSENFRRWLPSELCLKSEVEGKKRNGGAPGLQTTSSDALTYCALLKQTNGTGFLSRRCFFAPSPPGNPYAGGHPECTGTSQLFTVHRHTAFWILPRAGDPWQTTASSELDPVTVSQCLGSPRIAQSMDMGLSPHTHRHRCKVHAMVGNHKPLP